MRIRELLKRKDGDVVTVSPRSDIAAAVQLLLEHQIGGLPVVDDTGAPVGLVAERDLLKALHLDPNTDEGILIERVMRRPAPTCAIDDTIHEAMARMTHHRQRHLVVLDGSRIAGVISVGDIVRHRLEQVETERNVLRDVVTAQRAGRGGID
jgi:CBS domain-containing protein